MKRNVKWQGTKPVTCQICGRRFGSDDQHFYDFRIVMTGQWALGCETCWRRHGEGVGVGIGQRYVLKTLLKDAG